MNWLDDIKTLVHEKNINLVLPESEDLRIIEAAHIITKEKLGQIFLVGNSAKIEKISNNNNFDISNVKIIDPNTFDRKNEFIERYYELRKHKNISMQDAETIMLNPLFFGAMLVSSWDADCYVAGCATSTADVIRAAVQIIKPEQGIKTVSSSTLHFLNETCFGENGIILFADPGVVPDPNPEELADIAIAAAQKWEKLMKVSAKVAMLSFSTKGSAKHPLVDKVIQAVKIASEKCPNLIIDGELQLDAAVIPEIGMSKAKGSPVAGYANVLVFPDLNAANISYKLIERLGNTTAIGPLLQGMSKPCSDLSRGCSTQDIVDVSCIIMAEALEIKKEY